MREKRIGVVWERFRVGGMVIEMNIPDSLAVRDEDVKFSNDLIIRRVELSTIFQKLT